jgi:hypothetical protein
VESVSPGGDDRLKRILIRTRGAVGSETPTPGEA